VKPISNINSEKPKMIEFLTPPPPPSFTCAGPEINIPLEVAKFLPLAESSNYKAAG
jgi:hypothetical protein